LDEPDLDEPDLDNNFSIETRDEIINKKLLKDVGIELGGLELKSGGPGSHSNNKSLSQSKCRCSRDVTWGWKAAVSKGKSYEIGTNLKLLKTIMGFQRVYFPHSKAIGGHMGLRIKQLNTTDLQ
jgi:hypothetical protein